jgi:hypothetical protein
MNKWSPFVIREEPTESIIALLKSVTLGTNGAKYRHLNTEERLAQLYRPLYFTLERHERALGNITLCRRPCGWYVRYFAFDQLFQTGSPINASSGSGGLKKRINQFFEAAEQGDFEGLSDLLYAYIDPKNQRSLFISRNFGFQTVAKIATQTFSRVTPRESSRVRKIENTDELNALIRANFSNRPFFFDHHTFNDSPFYGLYLKEELVAVTKIHHANWVIEQLPGKKGKLLTKMVPYVPGLRRILKPASHQFIVVDTVWSKENDAGNVEELLSAVLALENRNLIIWWVDQQDGLYSAVKQTVQWGLLHRLNGVHEVDLVVRSSKKLNINSPTYTTGVDFI